MTDHTERRQHQKDERRSGAAVAPPPEMSGPPGTLLAAAVILAAGVLVYQSSFSGVFLFDDIHAIVENPCIRSLRPLTQALSAPPQSTVSGRPLVSLSLAINYALGGLNPRGYHAFNLLVHLACGLLLFGLARRTLSSERLRNRYGDAAPMLAGIIALLWVVHPLQTESVTYIIQRTETMMALCYLLTLYCVARASTSPRPLGWEIAAVAACAAGMSCKEVMVTAPLMVLLYDRIFLAGSFRQIAARRLRLYIGLVATWLILAALLAGGPRSASVGFAHGISAFEYAKNQCLALTTYVKLAFWPHPLILDYGEPQAVSLGQAAPYAAIVLGLLGLTVWTLVRRPAFGFLGVWFFVILAPTSSFVPITTEVIAERRVYLSLAGVIALTVIGIYEAINAAAEANRRRLLRLAAGGLAIALAGLAGKSAYERNREYQSEIRIWSDTLAMRPDNPRVHLDLGKSLVAENRIDEGIAHYRRALQLKSDFVDVHFNLGNALGKKGQYTEAVTEYEEALRLSPGYSRVLVNLGVALVQLNRCPEAVAVFEQILRDEGDSAAMLSNLATALHGAGRSDEALVNLQKAVRLEPQDPVNRGNLGVLLLRQGRAEEAAREFREALRFNPDNRQLQAGLNEAMKKLKHVTQE